MLDWSSRFFTNANGHGLTLNTASGISNPELNFRHIRRARVRPVVSIFDTAKSRLRPDVFGVDQILIEIGFQNGYSYQYGGVNNDSCSD